MFPECRLMGSNVREHRFLIVCAIACGKGCSRQLSMAFVGTVEICHNSRSQYDKLQELPVMNNSTRVSVDPGLPNDG